MFAIFRTIFFFPSATRDFTLSRSALLSSPSTIRPSSATTVTPSTSRVVVFNATLLSSSSERKSGGNRGRSRKAYPLYDISQSGLFDNSNHHAVNSSPSMTCSNRRYRIPTCSGGIPASASTMDNTWKHPRRLVQRKLHAEKLQIRGAPPDDPDDPAESLAASKSHSRHFGYSTVKIEGESQGPVVLQAQASRGNGGSKGNSAGV